MYVVTRTGDVGAFANRGKRHGLPPASDEGAAWHAKIAERVAKDYDRPMEMNAEASVDTPGAPR